MKSRGKLNYIDPQGSPSSSPSVNDFMDLTPILTESRCTIIRDDKDKILANFDKVLADAHRHAAKLLRNPTGEVAKTIPAWNLTKTGGRATLCLPGNLDCEDDLSAALVLLANTCPNVLIQTTPETYIPGDWTSEAKKILTGVISAVVAPPKSYSCTTSPIDLMSTSMWILASSIVVSDPKTQDAQAQVIPDTVGDTSVKKYLTKALMVLKGCCKDDSSKVGVETLEALIHMWARSQSNEALSLIRSQKIPWTSILRRGGSFETIKVKSREIHRLLTPSNPATSPWCSQSEKQRIKNAFAPTWQQIDTIARNWKLRSAEEQHHDFSAVVKEVKEFFSSIKHISQKVHSELGKRKKIIEAYFETKKDSIKIKKADAKNNFVKSAIFFKDSHELNLNEALLFFTPFSIAKDSEARSEAANDVYEQYINFKTVCKGDMKLYESTSSYSKEFRLWVDKFHPKGEVNMVWNEANTSFETPNKFSVLARLP